MERERQQFRRGYTQHEKEWNEKMKQRFGDWGKYEQEVRPPHTTLIDL